MNGLKSSYKQLMHGFAYIIPLAVVGGVFLNLYNQFNYNMLFDIGSLALFLIYPIFSAFIAYAISDKPGFIIGLVGGALVTQGDVGILGAIIIGFASGYLVQLFHLIFKKTPSSIKGLLPVFVYPVLGIIMIAFLYFGLETVLLPVNAFIANAFFQFGVIELMIITIILSMMMVYDLGGPVNKFAYMIAIISILNGIPSVFMTAVMIAGMMPPLSIYFASLIYKDKLTEEEYFIAKRNLWMGLAFISEGAMPFLKKNKKIGYIFMLSSVLVALLVVYYDVTSMIAHGGILSVFFIDKWLLFIMILIGISIFTALILGFVLKKEKN